MTASAGMMSPFRTIIRSPTLSFDTGTGRSPSGPRTVTASGKYALYVRSKFSVSYVLAWKIFPDEQKEDQAAHRIQKSRSRPREDV